MKKKKIILLLIFALGIFLFFFFELHSKLELNNFREQYLQRIIDFRTGNPVIATLGFFLLYVAVTALSLPGAAVMTIAAGAVFGLIWGTIVVSFASTVGATLAFLASRYLFREVVQKKFGKRLETVNRGFKREGGFYLFTMRLIAAIPFFVINLLMGLTSIKVWTFFWVSQVGMLAGTIVYVNAGTQVAKIESIGDLLSLPLILSFALLGILPLAAKKGIGVIIENRKK